MNHNLTKRSDSPGRFERSVATNRLPARQIPALIAYLSIHGQSFLEDLDTWMCARESIVATGTVGVGIHLFVDPDGIVGNPNAEGLVHPT